ncbi:MAG: hypothetical protein ACK55Z_34415 [bacterium]
MTTNDQQRTAANPLIDGGLQWHGTWWPYMETARFLEPCKNPSQIMLTMGVSSPLRRDPKSLSRLYIIKGVVL